MFDGRYLAINRVIYTRYHAVMDNRASSRLGYSSSESSASSPASLNSLAYNSGIELSARGGPGKEEGTREELNNDSVGDEADPDTLESGQEVAATGVLNNGDDSTSNGVVTDEDDGDGDGDGDGESDAGDGSAPAEDEDDFGIDSDKQSESSYEASSLMSGSDESDEEPGNVYIVVTVRQRGWRLYFECYEPLECKTYYPQVPEAVSRSMTAEFTRLNMIQRNAVIAVNIGNMVMQDGKKPGEYELVFQGQEDEELSESDV